MSEIKKILDSIEDAASRGRWDLVLYYLSQAIELARINADTEYLPSSQRG